MIKKIFLPEFFKNKRVYSQTILGFCVDEQKVSCVKVEAQPSTTIIKKLVQKEIFENDSSKAIKECLSDAGKFDQVYISIPASKVIFKELEVPFKDENKIRMILDYEIESKLPFAVEEAILDFIVTRQEEGRNDSRILVAAVRKQDLSEILSVYKNAGIDPTKITIDLFSVYSLYQQIPEYQKIKNSCAIMDLGSYSTRVAFLKDGKLRLTRVIPKGILSLVDSISEESGLDQKKVRDNIERFGFQAIGDSEYDKALNKCAIDFFHEIQFTLNSFSLKLNLQQATSKILFTGSYSKAKGLIAFCKKLLQINCEVFDCEKVFENTSFKNKVNKVAVNWSDYLVALGNVIPSIDVMNFNLRRKEFMIPQKNLVKNQILAIFSITFLLFLFLFSFGYFQIHRLSSTLNNMQKIEMGRLKTIFPKDFRVPKNISFKKLINKAEGFIKSELEMWGPFEKSQVQPLFILQELTNIIDKRRLDVVVESVFISEEDEKAKIEVKGFFRSKTGSDHYRYFFDELEKRFMESRKLVLDEPIDSRPKGNEGISFTVKLRLKEDEEVKI